MKTHNNTKVDERLHKIGDNELRNIQNSKVVVSLNQAGINLLYWRFEANPNI